MAAPAQAQVPALAGGLTAARALHVRPRLRLVALPGVPLFAAHTSTDSGSARPRPTAPSAPSRPRTSRRSPGPTTPRSSSPAPDRGDTNARLLPSDQNPVAVDEAHAETWRLVRRAQGGDGEAFGELYDRYFDVVYRFVYFRVHDHSLAEDITSEAFLRALRRITSISYQGRDIGAWFVTIARNIIFDHMKSARHRLETPTAEILDSAESAPSTESAVLASLESQRLMQAIGQLGVEQRECIVLRFVQGMSVSETAEIMGKKDGAIKALQHRAIRKLADIVQPDLS